MRVRNVQIRNRSSDRIRCLFLHPIPLAAKTFARGFGTCRCPAKRRRRRFAGRRDACLPWLRWNARRRKALRRRPDVRRPQIVHHSQNVGERISWLVPLSRAAPADYFGLPADPARRGRRADRFDADLRHSALARRLKAPRSTADRRQGPPQRARDRVAARWGVRAEARRPRRESRLDFAHAGELLTQKGRWSKLPARPGERASRRPGERAKEGNR